jgi:hypothetical protein
MEKEAEQSTPAKKTSSIMKGLGGGLGGFMRKSQNKKKEVPPYVLKDFPQITAQWSDFNEDTQDLLDELYEYDHIYGGYDKIFSRTNREDMEATKKLLKRYYLPVKNVFLVLQSQCSDLKNIEQQ